MKGLLWCLIGTVCVVLLFPACKTTCPQPSVKESAQAELETTPMGPATSEERRPREPEAAQPAGDPTYRLRALDFQIKEGLPYLPTGAQIFTNEGKVSLSKVMKELASLKGYSVSWADDVNQEQLVDVDIRPEDNYWDALNNILRQLDCFYTLREQTIVVKYKETKEYRLPIPFLNEEFNTSIGGNLLGGGEVKGKMRGEVLISNSVREPMDFWKMLEENLTRMIQVGGGGGYFVADRPLGTITVTATQTTHRRVSEYLESLRRQVYRQVVIEAKILEVILDQSSEMGIDWDGLFNNALSGTIEFGQGGAIYPSDGVKFISKVSLDPYKFDLVLSALKKYGETQILSNPKISLLNGRGATITVGENITYIDKVETTVDSETMTVTYTVTTASVLSGVGLAVMANIIDDDEVILYIVPITSELQEPIEYRQFGVSGEGAEVGLPRVRLKEMATFAKLRDGQGLIIGGLIDKLKATEEKKTPLLGDIPYLRRLFRWEKKQDTTRELVILLRPRIVQSAWD